MNIVRTGREKLSGILRARRRFGLTGRIVLGVGIGIALVFVGIGFVAMTALNQAIDAAGGEQVILAQVVAAEVSVELPSASGSAWAFPRLSSPAIPADLEIQVVNATGMVLFETPGSSAAETLDHLDLLRPLLRDHQPGYRIHLPRPDETFPPHIVAYAPVPGSAALGVIVLREQASILAAPGDFARRLLVAGLLALVVAVGIAWLDVHQIIRPLRVLADAADRFANGDLSDTIAIDRSDEVGSLALSFESMRQRLDRSLRRIEALNLELERRVAQRTSELERRNRQLAAINAVADILVSPSDLPTLLDRTLDRIRNGTGFDVASYRLFESDDSGAFGQGYPGRSTLHGGTEVAFDVGDPVETVARVGDDVASGITIPLVSGDRVEGMLFLGSRQAKPSEPGDNETLAAIGRQVGMTVANARLYEALRQRDQERVQLLDQVMAAHEEERRNLATELHDDVSQTLASVLLVLEGLPGADAPGKVSVPRLQQVRDLVATTLENVHNLAAELRTSLLDDIGLVAALERLVATFQERSSVRVDFQTVGVEGLHLLPIVETALFRIAEAAMSNVERHASAGLVAVLLQRRGDRLILVVEDDGRGFDVAAVRRAPLKDRLGLAGLEERAELIGARTTIESTPGRGTTIFVDLPVTENLASEADHAEN